MNAILNVAVAGRYAWYGRGQQRLLASLDMVGERSSHRMMWLNQWPGKSHADCPYGFKIDAFHHARASGIRRALWLDCSVWAVGPLTRVWDLIDAHGVLLLQDGWSVGQWTSDRALEIYGISRDEALTMPICYALIVGIDLTNPIGLHFLNRWTILRDAGAFLGPWNNDDHEASADPRCLGHRHDQSAASYLAHEIGIKMVDLNEILTVGREGPDRVFRGEGM